MNIPSFSIKGKVIWLTGATSGIGKALADELGARGALLALTARRQPELENIASALQKQGVVVRYYEGDVCDQKRMMTIAGLIEQDLGPIDCLIANAGTHIFTQPEKFNSNEYLGLMNINYGGMLYCIEAVLPSMIQRKSGYIVGVASLSGYRALPRAAAYGASKSAMIHFLESIRYHLEPLCIKVTVVNPGFVKTPLTDKNDFPMPFLIEAPEAAHSIVKGLERQVKEISFPRPFNWILQIARFLPEWIYEKIVKYLWHKTQKNRA